MDALDQDRAYQEIEEMEELLEQKILECSCYRKWMGNIVKHLQLCVKEEAENPPDVVMHFVHQCFDEIEQIKDQRR